VIHVRIVVARSFISLKLVQLNVLNLSNTAEKEFENHDDFLPSVVVVGSVVVVVVVGGVVVVVVVAGADVVVVVVGSSVVDVVVGTIKVIKIFEILVD
jgi:hypothetical protein